MNDKILGYSWDQIQARQQGKYKAPALDGPPTRPEPTDKDHKLLKEHGIDGLKKLGFYGVLDRLNLL